MSKSNDEIVAEANAQAERLKKAVVEMVTRLSGVAATVEAINDTLGEVGRSTQGAMSTSFLNRKE